MMRVAKLRREQGEREVKVLESRVIFVTDLHLWHDRPVNRTGDYAADMLRKVEYVYSTAMLEGIGLVIWGGDTTQRPGIELSVLNQFIAYTFAYIASGGRVLFAVGEHDCYGRVASTCSALQNILLSSRFTDSRVIVGLDQNDVLGILQTSIDVQSEEYTSTVDIACIPFPQTSDELAAGVEAMRHLEDFPLIVLHHPVHPGAPPWEHVNSYVLPLREGQAALCGHVHEFLPVCKTASGGVCIFPGALARRSESEANRPIGMFIISVSGSKVIHYEFVRIPCRDPIGLFVTPQTSLVGKAVEKVRRALRLIPKDDDSVDVEEQLMARLVGEDEAVVSAAIEAFGLASNEEEG